MMRVMSHSRTAGAAYGCRDLWSGDFNAGSDGSYYTFGEWSSVMAEQLGGKFLGNLRFAALFQVAINWKIWPMAI